MLSMDFSLIPSYILALLASLLLLLFVLIVIILATNYGSRIRFLKSQLLTKGHPQRASFQYSYVPRNAIGSEHVTIMSKPIVDFSFVFYISRKSKLIYQTVQKINDFLKVFIPSIGLSTYEIVVVTAIDKTTQDQQISNVHRDFPNAIIFEIENKYGVYIQLCSGILHCRGQYIFAFFPFLAISLIDIAPMFVELKNIMFRYNDKRAIIYGLWPVIKKWQTAVNSTLGKFITWATNQVYITHGIDTTALNRSRCLLMTREAAMDIIPNIAYDIAAEFEMYFICGTLKIPCSSYINTVSEKHCPSFSAIFRLAEFNISIYLAFLYYIGFIQIERIYRGNPQLVNNNNNNNNNDQKGELS